MIELKDLIFNLKNLVLVKEAQKSLILEIIKKHTQLQLNSKNIKIQKGVIYLKVKPIYRNEIFLKKEIILAELKKELKNKSPDQII